MSIQTLCKVGLSLVLFSTSLFGSDRVVGNLQLVERSIAVDTDECLRDLRSTSIRAICLVEPLTKGQGCHDYDLLTPNNSKRFVFKINGKHAAVKFIPFACGYTVEVDNLSTRSHASLIVEAASQLPNGELQFYVHTL